MLTTEQIDRIVKKVALKNLNGEVRRVFNEPTVDSDGEEAIQVTIVVQEGAADRITGKAALDTLVGIRMGLNEAGDGRLAFISYATETELADVGDP